MWSLPFALLLLLLFGLKYNKQIHNNNNNKKEFELKLHQKLISSKSLMATTQNPVIYELCIQWQTRNPINFPPKILTQCWYLTSNMLIMCLQKTAKNINEFSFFCSYYLILNLVHRISMQKQRAKKS